MHKQSSTNGIVAPPDVPDVRQWTQQHLEAAHVPQSTATPPLQPDLEPDVNAQGPGKLRDLTRYVWDSVLWWSNL